MIQTWNSAWLCMSVFHARSIYRTHKEFVYILVHRSRISAVAILCAHVLFTQVFCCSAQHRHKILMFSGESAQIPFLSSCL